MARNGRKITGRGLEPFVLAGLVSFAALAAIMSTSIVSDCVVPRAWKSSDIDTSGTMAWTTMEVVSTESTAESWCPSITVDDTNNVHVAWQDHTNYNGAGTDWDIFYKWWNITSDTWSATEVISTESTNDSYAPVLAADGTGNLHLMWHDSTNYSGSGTDYDLFYKVRNATTGTWSSLEVVSTESTSDSEFPSLVVDGTNNVHVAWYDYTDGGTGLDQDIFYKVRNATTGTWSSLEVVSTESTGSSIYPSLGVDGTGNVHVAWQDKTNYNGSGSDLDVFYKLRNATSGTWTITEVISPWSMNHSSEPSLAVDGAGNVHATWNEDIEGADGWVTNWDVIYMLRNATTGIWTGPEVISPESTKISGGSNLVVNDAGNVHVVWSDYTDLTGTGKDLSDIFYRLRNATTGTWSSIEVVSTESTDTSSNPSLAVDGAGAVHVTWEDATNNGGVALDWDIFYKRFTIINAPAITGSDPLAVFGVAFAIVASIGLVLLRKKQTNL